ncbi:MAG: 16S rRNA (guanine(966)-N(2))-methyltransferase RsmD [Magnetococcales bacterium]|nr:16S rRNA (guanine(966)-N(2))-methyltransferase RsmD [Magnetococcales bacterium]
MVRITGGRLRGRRLRVPASGSVRPTTDRVRLALFSMVMERLPGARVLDLFAGSGVLGIEALSRGAARAVFVESVRKTVETIRTNLIQCGLEQEGRVVPGSVLEDVTFQRLLDGAPDSTHPPLFDLVFMDPPYAKSWIAPTLVRLAATPLTGPGTLVAAELAAQSPPLTDTGPWQLWKSRRYGATALTLWHWPPVQPVFRSSQVPGP